MDAYRCIEHGKTLYTETAIGPSCQRLDLKTHPSGAEAVPRQPREWDIWRSRRDHDVHRSLDREAAARVRRRQAELRALGSGPTRSERPYRHGFRSRGSPHRGARP